MTIRLHTLLHGAFEGGMVLKAANAIGELVGAFLLLFVSSDKIARLLVWLAHAELMEEPTDKIANYLSTLAHTLSISGQQFAAIYLLVHGIVKLGLVIALVRRQLWAYPLAMGVFGLFIVYQTYRYIVHPSPWLIAMSALDVLIIILTSFEYRTLRERHMPELYT